MVKKSGESGESGEIEQWREFSPKVEKFISMRSLFISLSPRGRHRIRAEVGFELAI